MAKYRQRIEDIADELLDEAIERGSFDLVRDCAGLLPIRVICDLLGLSQVDADRLGCHQAVVPRVTSVVRGLASFPAVPGKIDKRLNHPVNHPSRSVRRCLRSWPTGRRWGPAASPRASPATPPAARTAAGRSARRCG